MTPMRTEACTLNFTAPNCDDLPAAQGDGFIATYWRPDAEELAALNAGLPVKLSVAGTRHPRVMLEVEAL